MIEIIVDGNKYRVTGTDITGTSIRPSVEATHALVAAGFDLNEQIVVRAPASERHLRITERHNRTLGDALARWLR